MSDLIERQKAIDVLCTENCHEEGRWCDDGDCSAVRRLKALPSVQLDIIHCKDCIWYELPSHRITENCVRWMKSNGVLLPIKPDDFCSRAERITDEGGSGWMK